MPYKKMVTIILPLAHIALTGSIYSTLALTIERFITVCHPFFKFSSKWTARTYLIPISIFTLVYNLPKFFELKVKSYIYRKTTFIF